MGWFARRLLGPPRSAREIEYLSFDVERLVLCGFGMGEHRSIIEGRLGPPEAYLLRRKGWLHYHSLGIALCLDKALKLDAIMVYGPGITASGDTLFSPFPGRLLPEGLGYHPNEDAFVELLGAPDERVEDPEGPSLEWHKGSIILCADFTLDDKFAEFDILWAG